jgi:hypothetical protein
MNDSDEWVWDFFSNFEDDDMNALVNAVSVGDFDDISELAVGDVVKFNYQGYKQYDSFNKGQPLEVIEVGRGPTGNLIFRGKQKKLNKFDRAQLEAYIETPFLSAKFFRVVSRATPAPEPAKSQAELDMIIIEATSYKVEKMCNSAALKAEVDAILRKDMNKKLLVFKKSATVTVGELPIMWDYAK